MEVGLWIWSTLLNGLHDRTDSLSKQDNIGSSLVCTHGWSVDLHADTHLIPLN
jgi:hypothetical protein